MNFAIRSVARLLLTSLPMNILKKFKMNEDSILLQRKGEMESENKRMIKASEISKTFKKLAFMTVVKSSNSHHVPETTKMKLFTVGGIQFVITRYSQEAMNKVYGGQLVPYIASKHRSLIFRLFQNAHIKHSPGHIHDNGVFHIPLQATLTAMRYGDYAAVATNQRGTISQFFNRCPVCIIKGQSSNPFSHNPEDPRIMSLLGAENVAFSVISIDLVSEIWVRHHSKSRGKPSHPILVEIACDLGSGAIAMIMSSDSKSCAVRKSLKILSLRYKMPSKIVTDKGSSLANLVSRPDLLAQLSEQDIQIFPVGQGEQASYFVERQIKSAKQILSSMNEDSNKSVYNQTNTQEELQAKLYSIESILNSRPILMHTKSAEAMVITPKMLISPFLSVDKYQDWLIDALDPLVAISHNAQILRPNNNAANAQLQSDLLCYLQQEGLRYQIVEGDNSKPDRLALKPEKDDIVIFKNSEKQLRFGVIIQILPKNMVEIRQVHNRVIVTTIKHIRNLKLLFRKSEWGKGGIPIEKQSDF